MFYATYRNLNRIKQSILCDIAFPQHDDNQYENTAIFCLRHECSMLWADWVGGPEGKKKLIWPKNIACVTFSVWNKQTFSRPVKPKLCLVNTYLINLTLLSFILLVVHFFTLCDHWTKFLNYWHFLVESNSILWMLIWRCNEQWEMSQGLDRHYKRVM